VWLIHFCKSSIPWTSKNFKNFAVFYTYCSYRFSYRIETWLILVFCTLEFQLLIWCYWIIFARVKPLNLWKILELIAFWIFIYYLFFFFFDIFAGIALKFVYCFVVKSYNSCLLFGVIDLLYTKIDGRIMPSLHCSCFFCIIKLEMKVTMYKLQTLQKCSLQTVFVTFVSQWSRDISDMDRL
jgi:hypothetical protein